MAVAMKGLRLKPTYEQLIGVAVSDELRNIKFPNRDETFLRNGFVLSQLDGEGQRAMEHQQELASKEAYKEYLLKEIAKNTGANFHDLRNDNHQDLRTERINQAITPIRRPETFDMAQDDDVDDVYSSANTTPVFETPIVSDYSGRVNRILDFEEEEQINARNRQENKREQTRQELSNILDDLEPNIVERASGSGDTQNYELVVKKDIEAEDTSRGRGRPPKPKPEKREIGTDDTDKKRGRPPKKKEVFKDPEEGIKKPSVEEAIAYIKKTREELNKLEEKNKQSTNERVWHTKQLRTIVKEFNTRTGSDIKLNKKGRVSKAYAPNGNEMSKTQMIKIIIEHNMKMSSQALRGMKNN
jgi:hypothetical protein